MKQTFDALQSLSERVSTRKDVADRSLDKTAIGIEFSTKNLVNPKPYTEGTTILTHAPPDGDTVRLARNSSDNSLRIINDATGNTSAYFYRDGKAYINLTDLAIEWQHLQLPSVYNATLYDDTVNQRTLANDTRSQSQGTASMRTIGGSGGSLSAAASNHTHA